MKTIETAISVNPDGSAVVELQLPGNLSAGVHRAVVIVEEQPVVAGQHRRYAPEFAAAGIRGLAQGLRLPSRGFIW